MGTSNLVAYPHLPTRTSEITNYANTYYSEYWYKTPVKRAGVVKQYKNAGNYDAPGLDQKEPEKKTVATSSSKKNSSNISCFLDK